MFVAYEVESVLTFFFDYLLTLFHHALCDLRRMFDPNTIVFGYDSIWIVHTTQPIMK